MQIHLKDRNRFSAVPVGLRLLEAIREQGGARFQWNAPKGKDRWMIDLYAGGPELREGKVNISDLLARWSKEAAEFRLRSKKYQLYQ